MGVGGGLGIGPVNGTADVYIAENGVMLYGELDGINLQQLGDALLADLGVRTPPSLVQTLLDVSFQSLSLYFNEGASITFNGQTWPPGFKFSAQQLNLWDIIRGNASIAVLRWPPLRASAGNWPLTRHVLLCACGVARVSQSMRACSPSIC